MNLAQTWINTAFGSWQKLQWPDVFYLILMETNVPFYVVSLYVAIFRNVTSMLMQTYSMNMSALPVII